jgi:hypothetical protein
VLSEDDIGHRRSSFDTTGSVLCFAGHYLQPLNGFLLSSRHRSRHKGCDNGLQHDGKC